MTVWVADKTLRLTNNGRMVVGGSPLKLLRLTESGAAHLQRIVAGQDVPTNSLTTKLNDAGIIHPVTSPWESLDQVSVVIPAYQPDLEALQRLVTDLGPVARVVIVDDASPQPLAPITGAMVIRQAINGGPAMARTTGLTHVDTPFVVFVDTDVSVSHDALALLCGHFDDERVAAAAPRLSSRPGAGLISRYEQARSPLDLGPEPALVRPGTRVSYVPSAVLACRVQALHDVGGFNALLRFGEDVDLVWRLAQRGLRVRYEPNAVALHDPRPTPKAWLAQRFNYGSSAAPLAALHPGALAPVRMNRWSFVSWAVGVVSPPAGLVLAVGTTVALMRRLRHLPGGLAHAARLAGMGHLYAGKSLANALTRTWWPLTAAAMMFSKRARRVGALAVLVPSLANWFTLRPTMNPATFTALHLADDLAYGTGVLAGCIHHKSTAAITPDLRRNVDG